MVVAFALLVVDYDIPNTFNERVCNSEGGQWKLTKQEKVKSLHENQTWELIELPKGLRSIGIKQGYTKK